MDDNGWFKIYRKITNWEWFQDSHMVHILIYLIAKANTADKRWQGLEIKRGQLITSRATIAADTGIREQTVRTCIRHLVETGEIKIEPTKRYTLVTICKYDDYQGWPTNHQPSGNQELTNHQPSGNQELTTTKEDNRIKEQKEIVDDSAHAREIEALTEEIKNSQIMMESLCMTQHITPKQYKGLCEDFKLEQQAKEATYWNSSDFRRHAWDWMRKHITYNELDENGHVKQTTTKEGDNNGNHSRFISKSESDRALDEADRQDLIKLGIDPDKFKQLDPTADLPF